MKSPAFLFYSKDWLTSTVELSAEARGVYINLLCHQHINGDLPKEKHKLAIIGAIDPEQFDEVWKEISGRFDQKGDRLVNQKLYHVVDQWSDRKLKNRVNGCLPQVVSKFRLTAKQKKDVYANVRKLINYEDFENLDTEKVNQMLYQMVEQTVYLMGDYIANAKEDIGIRIDKFKNEIRKHIGSMYGNGIFTDEDAKAFFNYWGELNHTKSAMRNEMQSTWDTTGRITRWMLNKKK